ncbi:hypothetical protein MKQ70_10635 [Chitinophaga sedimenti]|uniref:hypothetical protein n=1 Tax=Chitinophaga sedimenti TaxID=2033606 RepID=UPI002004ED18|nr:hypothetical protein [Chitinophaga sedimenti]MCK7555437.1 hypothetical protein [Chitinophaga sedimenti]
MMFRLVRLGGDLYGDLFPIGVKNAKGDDNYGFTLNHLSTHTLAKVAINDDATISLRPVAGDYVKSQLLAGNMNLRYEYDELFGSFVITASSEEMQQFIVKYGKSDRLFAADPVILQKKTNRCTKSLLILYSDGCNTGILDLYVLRVRTGL